MANIAFIEPRRSFEAYGYYRIPPMGPLCLGTILKEVGHEVPVLRDDVRSVHDREKGWLHEALTQTDVVAMSIMTPVANRVHQIADAIREVRVPRIWLREHSNMPTWS